VQNPVSWDYLTASIRDTPTWGPLSIFYVSVLGLTFLGSMFMYLDAQNRFEDHKLKRDTVRMGTQILMWIAGVGLFFFAIRYMRFEFLTFERRIWMYLTFLVFLGTVAYFVYYLRSVYPAKLAAFDRQRAKRRYAASGGKSGSRAGTTSRRGTSQRRRKVTR
jgi:hypothetical protein